MPSSAPAPDDELRDSADRYAVRYVLVVIVEIATLAGLYWFGRHFS